MVLLRLGMRAHWTKVFGVGICRLAAAAAALACMGAAPWSSPDSAQAAKVRFGGDQNVTRVVLELGQSAHGKLISPDANQTGVTQKVVLALPGVEAATMLGGQGEGLVRTWAMDHVAGATTLELTLNRPARVVRRFLLAPTEAAPRYRYVLDLAAAEPQLDKAVLVRPVPVSQPIHGRKVIVIDAGHGGKDPGALGAAAREKDLTLAAAEALRKRLERDGRYQVVLTRTDDAFVPLERRVQLARRAEADLFISLHADAGSDPSLRGATIYTLSDKGSDRVARNVMAKDDWFINVDMPSRDRSVNQILLDLTQRATKNQSSTFAQMLVGRVGAQTPMLQHSHRDAGYVVLLAPDVPAVLLEMGFITNPQDESLLSDTPRRVRLMSAVGDSIDDYFAAQRRYAAR